MMGIVSETWNLRVLLLLSPTVEFDVQSAGEAEAPSPSGFTHWQAQADSAPGVTVGAPGPSGPSHSSFQGPTLRQNVRHP